MRYYSVDSLLKNKKLKFASLLSTGIKAEIRGMLKMCVCF